MGGSQSTKKKGGPSTPNKTPLPSGGLDPLENLHTTPSETFRYLIIGFGTSAGYVAKELVHLKVAPGQICIVGDEPVHAYERPALSKAYMNPPGSKIRARIPDFNVAAGVQGQIQDADWYEGNGIRTMLATRVTGVNLGRKLIKAESTGTLSTKAAVSLIGYEKLIIATGASAARFPDTPGQDLDGIFYLRSEADFSDFVSRLEDPVVSKKRVVVLGGGYLSAEISSALTGWNKIDTIDVVFPDGILMKHMPFPDDSKRRLQDLIAQRSNGKITFHQGNAVKAFKGSGGKLRSVVLSDGSTLSTHLCVVAIGAKANIDLFRGKLDMANGQLVVDDTLRTTHPSRDVWAIGDCARADMGVDGVRRMAAFAANSAYASIKGKEESGVFTINTKYHYSRMYEHLESSKAVTFQIHGRVLLAYEAHEFVKNETTFGCIWAEPRSKLCKAGFLCSFGGDIQRFNLLKDCVVVSRDVDESIAKLKEDLM